MVGVLRHGEGEGVPQGSRREMNVGIGEQQPLAASDLDAALQRMNLAKPAVGQRLDMNRAQARLARGQPIDNGASGVGGAVVDDDDFKKGIVLLRQSHQRRFEMRCLVAGGDHDAQHGPALGRGNGRGFERRQPLTCPHEIGKRRHPQSAKEAEKYRWTDIHLIRFSGAGLNCSGAVRIRYDLRP